MDRNRLIERAKNQFAEIENRQKDTRYSRVVGKLIHAGLLSHVSIAPSARRVSLQDALWAGEIEPRILALLPAILLKKPRFFSTLGGGIPDDLKEIVDGIRRGESTGEFRGITPHEYRRWIPRIGHKNKYPSCVKTFRFSRQDIDVLNELKKRQPEASEISILRAALRALHSRAD